MTWELKDEAGSVSLVASAVCVVQAMLRKGCVAMVDKNYVVMLNKNWNWELLSLSLTRTVPRLTALSQHDRREIASHETGSSRFCI